MSDAMTNLRQARGFLKTGDATRAVELLERARLLARGDQAAMRLVLKELVGAYEATGNLDKADRYQGQLDSLGAGNDPAGSATPGSLERLMTPVPAPPARPTAIHPMVYVGGGIFGCLLAAGAFYLASSRNVPSPPNSPTVLATGLPAGHVVPVTGVVAPTGSLSVPTNIPPLPILMSGASVDWAELDRRIEPSVYQVQIYLKTGGEPQLWKVGTAWSATPGRLVTNAHVAEDVSEGTRKGGFAIARRGEASNDLRIIGQRIHPGYEDSEKLWQVYRPYLPQERKFMEQQFVPCDVAILEVRQEDIPRQGPPIPLAEDRSICVGMRVGCLGYPADGVGRNLDRPTPDFETADVNRLYGLMLEKAASGQETFLQHSANTRRGSSGSPLFNDRGEVVGVNFASDVIAETENKNAIDVSGFKYAVPVSMVKELLDNLADSSQAVRHRAWETLLHQQFDQGVADPQRVLKGCSDQCLYTQLIPRKLASEKAQAKPIDSGVVTINAGARNEVLKLPTGGTYIFCFCGDQPGNDLEVDVFAGDATLPVTAEGARAYVGWQEIPGVPQALDLHVRYAYPGRQIKVSWMLSKVIDP